MNERLSEYLEQLQNGETSPESVEALAGLLQSSGAADRSRFLEHILFDVHLQEAFAEQEALAEHFTIPLSAPAELAGKEKAPPSRVGGWFAASVAACLLMALGAGVHCWLTRTEQVPVVQAPADKARAAPMVAELEQMEGEVLVVNQERKTPAHLGQMLLPGQGIVTRGTESEAVVKLDDDARMNVGGDTVVFTSSQGDEDSRLVVEQGNLVVNVGRILKRKMKVQTSLGIAVSEAETSLQVIDGTGLAVVRGQVHFTHKASGKSIQIKEGHYLVATREGELSSGRLFSGKGNAWAIFPKAGLDTRAVTFSLAFSFDGKWLAAADRAAEKGVRSHDEPD